MLSREESVMIYVKFRHCYIQIVVSKCNTLCGAFHLHRFRADNSMNEQISLLLCERNNLYIDITRYRSLSIFANKPRIFQRSPLSHRW